MNTYVENIQCRQGVSFYFLQTQIDSILNSCPQHQSFEELELSIKEESKKLGINFLLHFGIREFYQDGTTVGFCTNEEWNKIVNSSEITLEMGRHYFDELIDVVHKNVRYILRTKDRANNSFLKHLVNLNMATSLILYRHEQDIIKGYYFIIHPLDSGAISFFINNLGLFEKLIDRINPILYKSLPLQNTLKNPISLFSIDKVKRIFGNKNSKIVSSKYQVIFKGGEYTFTPTEIKILEMIGSNCTSKEIGKQLGISYRTVEWHLKNIKNKLGTSSKLEIVEFTKQAKIIY